MNKKKWVDLSLVSLCIVAAWGFILRSKAVFPLRFVDYTNFLNAHSHFAFGGWLTLVILVLMVYDLLPETQNPPQIYFRLLWIVLLTSLGMLVTFSLQGYGYTSIAFTIFYFIIIYYFIWNLTRDIRNAGRSRTVLLLTMSALFCLALSSVGPIALAYMLISKSFHPFLYRDANFTYLHFQYNGFFTLSVFSLLFQKIESKFDDKARKNFYRFAVLLCISVVPSLFLSYLWQDPEMIIRIVAVIGSLLILLAFTWFIISAMSIKNILKSWDPLESTCRHASLSIL